MKFHIFNPENDLALADGGFSYCPPPAATRIAKDLATLPLWFATAVDAVYLPDEHHCEYHIAMSSLFSLPTPFLSSMRDGITSLAPWGWSPQMRHRLKSMGFDPSLLPTDFQIDEMRRLSNRRTSIEILTMLHSLGVDVPPFPCYYTSIEEVKDFICARERCVIKAPWSGSGKGIMWGIGRVEEAMEHFCRGVIRRQGGIVCEHYLNPVKEFAMEFFSSGDGVEFAGYSLFTSEKGSYAGNILLSNAQIEARLVELLPGFNFSRLKEMLCGIMQQLLAKSGYIGYLGIDMMIYNNGDGNRLNPCMELNLRMNMGVVARIFFDRYVAEGACGHYSVSYFKKEGEALNLHLELSKSHPLKVLEGRILEGYINLSPVRHESRYIAYAVIE
ncbi:MAG: hypothetical protein IIV89_06670 [Bacteroidaceae bacterium]|nr:hypothetical protein [Bacteroidaceae bacterium]